MSVISINYDGSRSETYKGCVLCTRERNYYDDSDFYAVVWDEETQEVTSVMYATTRCACDGDARADATPEVIAKASAWLKAWALNRVRVEMVHEAEQKARTVEIGSTVKVVRGKKVPVGTIGEVFWMGEKRYNGSYPQTRIGFKDEHGTVFWTGLRNVEKIAEAWSPDEAQIEALAQRAVDHKMFHLPFATGRGLVVM